MKKEFLVAAQGNRKGGTEETRVTENVVFNPFKKWWGKRDVPQPADGDVSEDKAGEYAAVFLVRKESAPRKQTYISQEVCTRLGCILPLISQGMTVPAFLDNVLACHLETHAEELRELFDCKVRSIGLKREQAIAPALRNKVEAYAATFLIRKEPVSRKQTYINRDIYAKLARVLPLFCDGMTVPVFLDNVLAYHLTTHAGELKELFDRNTGNMKF